jgi:tetratricopeptide (TPR) repeat protein
MLRENGSVCEWAWSRVAAALLCGVGAFALLQASATAQADLPSAEPAKQEVSKEASAKKKLSKEERALLKKARRELVDAGKVGRAPRGTPTVERVKLLERAVQIFAQIEQSYAQQPQIVAEASFRRGQLLGRLGRPDEAQQAFERSAGLGKDKWAARSYYEAGNAQRRAKRWTKGLELYRKGAQAVDAKYATKCRLEVGRALIVLGRVPEAREEFGKLARDTKCDAFERVRAFDDLAGSFLSEQRFEPAQELLDETREALAKESSGGDKRSVRLARSIERMRSRKKLEKIQGEKEKDSK